MYYDSQSALHITRNHVFHSITKYIDVQYRFIQEVVEDESVNLIKTHTKKNLADVLIKLKILISINGVDPFIA